MLHCGRFSFGQEEEKPKPVRKRFDFIFQVGGKVMGFNAIGAPYYITGPITSIYKGIVYTYLCTEDGSIYSTTKLEKFDEEGGDEK